MELKEMKCQPCHSNTKPMQATIIKEKLKDLQQGWSTAENDTMIKKEFNFEDFKRAIAFVDDIALLAEREQHHPDICIRFNKVEVVPSTHAIGGLSDNDFIMAAKIEEL
jgi:4a-hydroxytetrahydrobiopterin dehydratase